jgi:elongation factor G
MREQAEPNRFYRGAGDGAAVGFKDIKTGDTLCDEKHQLSSKYEIPCASNGIAIEPKTKLM